MLASLGTAALRTLLLVGMTSLCLRLMRVRAAQALLTCWTAVLAASLAMPLLQQVVTIPWPVLTALPVADLPALADGISPATARPPAQETQIPAPQLWRQWLGTIYSVVSVAMLLRVMLGVGLSSRMLRQARLLSLDGARGLRVRVGTGVSGPVTLGSTVLLPPDCVMWSEDTLRAVMAHEGAHARAGDFYILLMSQLGRALFWFSPVSWWLHDRLTMLAEMASDDAALAELGDRPGYARILLDMARQTGGLRVGVAMARPATVERRIERVLAEGEVPPRTGGVERVLVAAGVLCLAVIAAASFTGRSGVGRSPLVVRPPPYRQIAVDPHVLDRYAGYYRDSGNGSIMIVARDGDHMTTHRAGFPPVPEYPYTDREFFLTTVPQQNTFVVGPSASVIGVVHHQNGRDEVLDRIDAAFGRSLTAAVEQRLAEERAAHAEQPVDPALLDTYAGVYALSSRLTAKVSRYGGVLDVQFNGRPAQAFHAYGNSEFFSTDAAAQISFVAGQGGKARTFILHQNGEDRVANRMDPAAAREPDEQPIR